MWLPSFTPVPQQMAGSEHNLRGKQSQSVADGTVFE